MYIMIMDGQGGGVGKTLVEAILAQCPTAEIVAVGTNAMATANMLKGGKIAGATGENAVIYNSKQADVIIGPMGIVLANSMYGEITPSMACAVAESSAKVILIPMSKCPVEVIGVTNKKVSSYVEEAIEYIKRMEKENE